MNFSVLICDQQLYTLARSSPSHYWINFTVDRSILISWGVISLGLKHISNMKWKLSSPNTETEQFMQNKQNQGKYHFILWKYRLFFNLYSKTHFILMSRKIFRKKNSFKLWILSSVHLWTCVTVCFKVNFGPASMSTFIESGHLWLLDTQAYVRASCNMHYLFEHLADLKVFKNSLSKASIKDIFFCIFLFWSLISYMFSERDLSN